MAKPNRIAEVSEQCVSCGCCVMVCPRSAISVYKGMYAVVDKEKCIGCGICASACPAAVISISSKEVVVKDHKRKHWYDYLWIVSPVYLTLGFFNILFAWLGLVFFLTPLFIAIFGGNKVYCNRYCDRGQFFELLGGKLRMSLRKNPPLLLKSRWFRYGFLTFFMTMFALMIYNTYLVFAGQSLREAVTLLWMWRLPWHWADISFVTPWVAQFAFGLYGVMLTSNIIGLVTMLIWKPRTWCVFCPMGTMTQGICKIKHRVSREPSP